MYEETGTISVTSFLKFNEWIPACAYVLVVLPLLFHISM